MVHTEAAEQGYAQAQFFLWGDVSQGAGVLQDNLYAHMWFDISASLGNENASETKAIIVLKRMTPNISKARELLQNVSLRTTRGVDAL